MPTTLEEIRIKPVFQPSVKNMTIYLFAAQEIILILRLIFKLLGSSAENNLVGFIYSLSSLFIVPFEGFFAKAIVDTSEAPYVLEPATFIAILIYALIAGLILKLIPAETAEEPFN